MEEGAEPLVGRIVVKVWVGETEGVTVFDGPASEGADFVAKLAQRFVDEPAVPCSYEGTIHTFYSAHVRRLETIMYPPDPSG